MENAKCFLVPKFKECIKMGIEACVGERHGPTYQQKKH